MRGARLSRAFPSRVRIRSRSLPRRRFGLLRQRTGFLGISSNRGRLRRSSVFAAPHNRFGDVTRLHSVNHRDGCLGRMRSINDWCNGRRCGDNIRRPRFDTPTLREGGRQSQNAPDRRADGKLAAPSVTRVRAVLFRYDCFDDY